MKDFIQLHTNDNVVVALKNLSASAFIEVDGRNIQLRSDIGFGHKIAIRPIPAGDKILKYGLSIGSATQNIEAGEHVHVQNVKTDYSIEK
jgi:altronate hydrolase